MKWIKLHGPSGAEVLVNLDLVGSFYAEQVINQNRPDESHYSTAAVIQGGSFGFRETVEQIETMIKEQG